jgi:hypothetical protein
VGESRCKRVVFVVELAGGHAVVELAEKSVEQVAVRLVFPVSGGAACIAVSACAHEAAQPSQRPDRAAGTGQLVGGDCSRLPRGGGSRYGRRAPPVTITEPPDSIINGHDVEVSMCEGTVLRVNIFRLRSRAVGGRPAADRLEGPDPVIIGVSVLAVCVCGESLAAPRATLLRGQRTDVPQATAQPAGEHAQWPGMGCRLRPWRSSASGTRVPRFASPGRASWLARRRHRGQSHEGMPAHGDR